jgi:hypothetical protein
MKQEEFPFAKEVTKEPKYYIDPNKELHRQLDLIERLEKEGKKVILEIKDDPREYIPFRILGYEIPEACRNMILNGIEFKHVTGVEEL